MDEYIIEPLFDNILVLPEEPVKKTTTGIILPNASGEAPTIGEVIAVGEGRSIPVLYKDKNGEDIIARLPMKIKAGDRILYKQWGTNSVKLNNKEYFLLKQEDALAIIRNKESNKTITN